MTAPLYYNEDSTDFFFHGDHTDGRAGANLDAYIDRIAAAGVTTFLCNTNAQRANYDSAVWTPTWEGFDPDGPDDQPYLAGLNAGGHVADVGNWRHLATNTLTVHEQGIDYPARVIERCRLRGMTPWITLRMNDVHDQMNPEHPIHGRFWYDHRQLWRHTSAGDHDSYYGNAFDFTHVEVRDYYMALIDETLDRYDIDGLELDFLREPYLFSVGEEETGCELLSEWVGKVRQRVDAAAARRGHVIQLGVRSPSVARVAKAYGMDPLRWAREGWLDLLVISPRWSTIEFAMPLRDWREQLGDSKLVLAGGLEILRGDHLTAPKRPVTAAEARGAAAQVLHDGVDAVYLFNYFPSVDPTATPDAWSAADYESTLTSLASLEHISALPRTHVITFVDLIGPEGSVADPPPQLPAEGTELHFELPTGPRPQEGRCELVIGLRAEADQPGAARTAEPATSSQSSPATGVAEPASSSAVAPTLRVNDGPELVISSVTTDGEFRDSELHHLKYALPVEILVDGSSPNRIHLSSQEPVQVESVEIRIIPA